MCEPTTILAVTTMVATAAQGYSGYQQGKFQEGVENYNAVLNENEATRIRNIGLEEENKQRRETAELVSRQRAVLASRGVNLDSGSALQLQTDAKTLGEIDALRIRDNFTVQAEAKEQAAMLHRLQGKAAKAAGRNAFAMSLVKAGTSFLGSAPGQAMATKVSSKWQSWGNPLRSTKAADSYGFLPWEDPFAG